MKLINVHTSFLFPLLLMKSMSLLNRYIPINTNNVKLPMVAPYFLKRHKFVKSLWQSYLSCSNK